MRYKFIFYGLELFLMIHVYIWYNSITNGCHGNIIVRKSTFIHSACLTIQLHADIHHEKHLNIPL